MLGSPGLLGLWCVTSTREVPRAFSVSFPHFSGFITLSNHIFGGSYVFRIAKSYIIDLHAQEERKER